MTDKKKSNALSIALGTGFAVTLAATGMANAVENPFAADELDNGYMVAAHHGDGEGKCGEGKCGDKDGEGSCGSKGDSEGKCGEGKCGS